MNRVTVKINGMDYTLKGEETEEYLYKIASSVDKKLNNIMYINPRLDINSASILTAVNVVDEMMKEKNSLDELEAENEKLRKSETVLQEEVLSLKQQLGNLEAYVEELKEKISTKKDDEIKEKDEIISKLKDSLQVKISEINQLRTQNNELRFQNQSAKYKIVDLQKKLFDSHIATPKKNNFGNNQNNVSNK